jgi:thiamine kinase-like enzyme
MAVYIDDVNTTKQTNDEIDSMELSQRVAVLKRFKTLLTQQRDRFRNYLDLLDKQQSVIESGSAEDLLNYVEIEEKIVADIFSIQKVIDPLEKMYYTVVSSPEKVKTQSNDEVPSLKASLEKLQSEAVIRSTKNKELLSKRMLELRMEIKNLRNNPYAARRFGFTNAPSLVDLKG